MGRAILITDATGKAGAHTGPLLQRGDRVRAFVHHKNARSTPLEKQGVEIAVEDEAHVIAFILEHFEPHAGKVHPLSAPSRSTMPHRRRSRPDARRLGAIRTAGIG